MHLFNVTFYPPHVPTSKTRQTERHIWKNGNASPRLRGPPTKTKGDKTRTQKKGGDNSSGGRNPKKKKKGRRQCKGTQSKKKGGIIQGQTTHHKNGGDIFLFRGDHSSWLILRSTLSYLPGNRLTFLPNYYLHISNLSTLRLFPLNLNIFNTTIKLQTECYNIIKKSQCRNLDKDIIINDLFKISSSTSSSSS